MSTANLFGLPTFCQYGVGGPGFGAWRELAANTMATNWVLARQTEAFPLMYHWRVLPGAAPLADEHTDIEKAVAYWGGTAAPRRCGSGCTPLPRHQSASCCSWNTSHTICAACMAAALCRSFGNIDDVARTPKRTDPAGHGIHFWGHFPQNDPS